MSEVKKPASKVEAEKSQPSEHQTFKQRAVVRNHTVAGTPADVHQALVASSRLFVNEASAYEFIFAVLHDYDGKDSGYQLPSDLREHLGDALTELEHKAKVHHNSRSLLEKYA